MVIFSLLKVCRAVSGCCAPRISRRSRLSSSVFAANLSLPFGIAFWPPGPSPRFVYVGETNRIIRYPYQPGDLQARGPAQVVVSSLPDGGHWTRDVVFSVDGKRMFVAVGSASNLARDLTGPPPPRLPTGAAWAEEANRADVLEFCPDGRRGENVRHRVAQLFGGGDPASDQRLVVRGERARWAGGQSAAGLCHTGRTRRVLWLAMVLYR